MKFGFYPKLAWTGMRQNRRLYLPYLLTCAAMIMMQYIIISLKESPMMETMSGGASAASLLGVGSFVILVFSVIFLFYTHSFLIRRRKKEFGLYNILGMNKINIARILMWESIFTLLFAIICGLGAGLLLSKLAELCLVNILGKPVSYTFFVSSAAIWQSILFYLPIFALIFLDTMRSIRVSNPITLLHSENSGEKPPKANWVLGILGFLILGAAYAIAITIKAPLEALIFYFLAVTLVILGTYLLFIAGSVLLCRILQKNKKYYYRPNHFISVSSMAYRMKRNGAGLASICILSTMVLVMISTTSCLYFGAEDSLHAQYPRDLIVETRLTGSEEQAQTTMTAIKEAVTDTMASAGVEPEKILDSRYVALYGILENGNFHWDSSSNSGDVNITCMNFRSINDYPEIAAAYPDLAPGEAVVCPVRTTLQSNTVVLDDFGTLTVRDTIHDFESDGGPIVSLTPILEVFLPDYADFTAPILECKNEYGDTLTSQKWTYGLNMSADDQKQTAIRYAVEEAIGQIPSASLSFSSCWITSLSENSADFYGAYGGLFFLGIMLSIVFLLATVLILYYKQISEGYEDQNRFEIMQKVGMTKKEIRSSINSQMLLVFLLPLGMSALHLLFDFPITQKLLMLFNLNNVGLFFATTAISFIIFTLFYLLTYRITSNAYCDIVSDAKEKR